MGQSILDGANNRQTEKLERENLGVSYFGEKGFESSHLENLKRPCICQGGGAHSEETCKDPKVSHMSDLQALSK